MILQFVHALMTLLCSKPDKKLQTTNPEEYRKLKMKYKKMLVFENLVAILVILMNIIITYTIVENIKLFNEDECSFQ